MTHTDQNKSIPSNKEILLFDGVCNLCDKFVQFVLYHDDKEQFIFASLQSSIGQQLLKKYKLDSDLNTVVLISKENAYTHSDVALKVGIALGGWMNVSYLCYLIPKFMRDMIYNWIAANRYRLFGKQEDCIVPKAEWKARFLDGVTSHNI